MMLSPVPFPMAIQESSRTTVLVDAQRVSRSYVHAGAISIALHEATCTIRSHDRIALVGRSGSGKSTLLHLLGGLDTPTAGTIGWPQFGSRTTLRPTHVAMVFQMPSLLPELTVGENVALPLLLQGQAWQAATAAAQVALNLVDLGALADKLPDELSGGQAQRVAVARAVVARPQLILADEPTGQLDRATAQHLLDVLLAALAGTSTALVIATHDRTVAELLDQVWTMDHGILERNS